MKLQDKFDPKNKKILLITAHPDDADFCCGGTLLKWLSLGAKAAIVIVTNGDKGSHQTELTQEQLSNIRKQEQEQASLFLGLEQTWFLDYPDAFLEVTQELKDKLVRIIRQYQPNVVFTWDPTMAYSLRRNMINHPDHRAVGQATLDACFPMARDFLTFLNHRDDGLTPHCVEDVFLFNFDQPNYFEDITSFVEKKIELLKLHKSQMNPATVGKSVQTWSADAGKLAGVNNAECFIHFNLKKN